MKSEILGAIATTLTVLLFITLVVWRVGSIHHQSQVMYCPKGDTMVVDYFAIPFIQDGVGCTSNP